MRNRDNFKKSVKDTLARRVGYKCSNPKCMRETVGPQKGKEDGSLCLGEAAHITAASPGGPRYDSTLTPDERASFQNGLWLCSNCALLIDRDPFYYTTSLLRSWKLKAEERAGEALIQGKVDKLAINDARLSYCFKPNFYIARSLEEKFEEPLELLKSFNPAFNLEGPGNYQLIKGYLFLDNEKQPYEEIEIKKYQLLGFVRYDISGRYFKVLISGKDQLNDFFVFGFDLNFKDVHRRLIGYKSVLPVLKSKKLTFAFLANRQKISVETSEIFNGNFLLEQSENNIELMTCILQIQNFYDIEFELPPKINNEIISRIDVIHSSINGEACLNLGSIPQKIIGNEDVEESISFEKTLLPVEKNLTEIIEIFGYQFIPNEYYILPGILEFDLQNKVWEIGNSGIPVTCTFACVPLV